MPGFPALTHVAITVTDLDASTRWYSALFDAAPVLDEDEESGEFHHAVFALDGGTLFGLHTHTGSAAPWMKLSESVDYLRAMAPPRAARARRSARTECRTNHRDA